MTIGADAVREAWGDLDKAIRPMLHAQPSSITQRAEELEAARLMMAAAIEKLDRKV